MSVYSIVTKEDMKKIAKLFEQQKHQRALKLKNRFLKHSHDELLAETFESILEKVKEVNESTEKLEDVSEKKDSEFVKSILPSLQIFQSQNLKL